MYKTYLTNGKQLSFEKAQVMAIINITPDSFYDGGKFSSVTDIIKDAEMKIYQGANIIDVGAASSRPKALSVTVKDEIFRLKEPLTKLRKEFPKMLISIDTYLSEVAQFGIDHGADIINDISGGELDDKMIDVVAKHQIAYVLMHMQGTPQNMQLNPTYENVVKELGDFYKGKIDYCKAKGFDKLIIDVGFGFGKTVEHNYELLKHLHEFAGFGFPLLVGLSRKSMINRVIHTSPVTALNGTTVLNTIALQNGAKILRVHDVKEAKQAIDLFEFYKSV
ncbi:MAG: folP [Bacteroidetes bacterium]|jgi:dihydropteroate synthase|nr:folP [Bacteroidota bacterium]MDF2450787.1 folP [Bacteroidota bacterium]